MANFEGGEIAITMPREIIPEWADTDLVSLYTEQKLSLEPGHHRNCEDDQDTYPHPSA